MGPLPASIHTFGFGYQLRSGLLKSISEIGGGNYAFIPDAGMIGTVFVHSVANLQSTFATNAVLKLTYTDPLQLEETTGEAVDKELPKQLNDPPLAFMGLTINLGNLQFGQSRDIFLRANNISQLDKREEAGLERGIVAATLSYSPTSHTSQGQGALMSMIYREPAPLTTVAIRRNIFDTTSLSEAEIAYHQSRSMICNFIASIFPMSKIGEHAIDRNQLPQRADELADLIKNLPSNSFTDEANASLVQDLVGEEPQGQISLALSRAVYLNKWGVHYLPSLLNAHTRQVCNSFKDPGPLQYCSDSPLFNKCRENLDNAFDNLPAPEPTAPEAPRWGNSSSSISSGPISMKRYRNVSGVCFAASTDVTLASGRTVEIRRLRRGMKVRTPMGPRRVAMVLKTPVEREILCRVDSVLVTPWHPISSDAKNWSFPATSATNAVLYTGSVYSVLLERGRNANAHAIRVGDLWGVTLGHGLTVGNDVRAHAFFGDYNAVGKSLVTLEKGGRKGVVVGGGVERDERTGLVQGFKARKVVDAPDAEYVIAKMGCTV